MSYALKYVDSLTFAPLPEPPKPAPAVGTPITVPAGTQLLIRMVDTLDTSKTDAGQRFTASLDTNLAANGLVVARKGTVVYGKGLGIELCGARSWKIQDDHSIDGNRHRRHGHAHHDRYL